MPTTCLNFLSPGVTRIRPSVRQRYRENFYTETTTYGTVPYNFPSSPRLRFGGTPRCRPTNDGYNTLCDLHLQRNVCTSRVSYSLLSYSPRRLSGLMENSIFA